MFVDENRAPRVQKTKVCVLSVVIVRLRLLQAGQLNAAVRLLTVQLQLVRGTLLRMGD